MFHQLSTPTAHRALLSFSLSVVLAASAGCASPSLRYAGHVTANPDARTRDVVTHRVPLTDQVVIVTQVTWPESGEVGGSHAVRWNWYDGNTLIAERAKTLDFGRTPYRFSRSLPASDLGIGHYRVEVLVDGVKVDEQLFDVVAS